MTPRRERPRVGWLDALRGIAALVVVFDHSSYAFLPHFRQELMPEFNTSRYGIMVFFLVSGYIIPASLERGGSVRTFWIGRLFRVYPLWAVAVTALAVLHALDLARIRPDLAQQPLATVAAAHLTMFQELLGTPNLLLVLWTLSYEMAFYLLTVALFTVGRHHRSATVAVTLAVLAAAGVAAGVSLPPSALSHALGAGPLVAITSVAMAAAVCCACTGRPVLRTAGGVLGGLLALLLVTANGTVPVWEGLTILAVMFLGTAIHRAEHGQVTWRATACAIAVVLLCAVASAHGHGDARQFTERGWLAAFLPAVLTFAAGWALRHRRTPRWLTVLGAISYSVYLLHPVMLAVTDATIGRSARDDLVLEAAFVAVLLPLSWLTHRYVETPPQRWGRALSRRPRGRAGG
ncbi:acyltransferase [Streptomyces sp. NPDC002132]|uniref:acyltransferase family protein n=1 Tax=unclassified Streptomyces TaxID=2593676 RepID=UPI00332FA85B